MTSFVAHLASWLLLPLSTLLFACGGASPEPRSPADEIPEGTISFAEGMTHPTLISGEAPAYTGVAKDTCRWGFTVAQCVVTTDGDVRACRIVEGVPGTEEHVLRAFKTWRMTPALKQGKPVNARYEFKLWVGPPRASMEDVDITRQVLEYARTAQEADGEPPDGGGPAQKKHIFITDPETGEKHPYRWKKGDPRPMLLCGRDPTYTKEALAKLVEGMFIARCVIGTDGSIGDCRVIKSLPGMEATILSALTSRRYTRILFKGKPIRVEYVFNIKLVLPERRPRRPP